MVKDKELSSDEPDLFEKYRDEITPAYEKAVREALRKHKRAGVPIAVTVDGEVVIIQPEEIDVQED